MPFANSIAIDASTKAQNVYVDEAGQRRAGAEAASSTPAGDDGDERRPGQRALQRAQIDARRQATSGPIPISSSSGSPKTRRKKLKYGGPTVTDSPRTASETIGKITPQRIVRHSATSRRLL